MLECAMNMQDLMANYDDQYKRTVRKHQRAMEKAREQYEKTMLAATAELEEITESVQDAVDEPTDAPPTAIWMDAPDGEKLMVLNQAAATMFLAIFTRLGEVVEDLQKSRSTK